MRKPEQYRNIFVDYFDTIVFRSVYPDMTKEIWAQRVSADIKFMLSPKQLLRFRSSYESAYYCRHDGKQFSYGELMAAVYDKIVRHVGDFPLCEKDFVAKAKEIDEKIELETQRLNDRLIALLRKEKETGKKIFIVSDFYLGRDSYELFLNKHGISDLFDGIYTSCDYGVCKATGALFKIALVCEKIDSGDTVMIGDTKYSDYIVPKRLGMGAVLCQNKKRKKSYAEQRRNDTAKRAVGLSTGNDWSDYAFSLYLFCDRLYCECVKAGIGKIFFLAREGAFLKVLFDKFLENREIKMDTRYLYASRNSVLCASCDDIGKEKFDILFKNYRKFSIEAFLKALCFDAAEIAGINIDGKDIETDEFADSDKFTALKQNAAFLAAYENKRLTQRRNFEKHLNKQGYVDGGDLCLVDVGWQGSMQDYIFKLFGGKVKTVGYYLGLYGGGGLSAKNDKIGLLFDYATGRAQSTSDIFFYEYILYELLLSAGHGKTVGYDDAGAPVLVDDEDIVAYKNHVERIQARIKAKFEAIAKIYDGRILDEKDVAAFETIHANIFKKMGVKLLGDWYDLLKLHIDSFIKVNRQEQSKMFFSVKKKAKILLKLGNYAKRKDFVNI